MALTPKQEAFINEYFKCWNATQAAIRAGYSEKTAYSIGSENLKKPEIAEVIRTRMTESAMSSDEVLFHLAQIARGDISDALDDNGNLDLRKAKERGVSNLIKKVKSRAITTEQSDIAESETEQYDRLKALELLGKVHGMFIDKTDHTSGGEKIKGYVAFSPDEWDES